MRYFKTPATGTFALAVALALSAWVLHPAQQQEPPQAQSQYSEQAPQDQPAPQPQNPPVVGTLNYLEGQASIGNQTLTASSVGNAALQNNQSLVTNTAGKAEILLTPGVLLRVGSDSSVRMVSASLSNTEVAVERGDATLEVGEIQKENIIVVDLPGGPVHISKQGFYDFDAAKNTVRVFKGEANVTVAGKEEKIGGGHEFILGTSLKAQGFDKKQYDTTDLYRWSVLRSSYLAEANIDAASQYAYSGAFTPGWYWDGWFDAYTWLPGEGILYSPFGWGFYSPYYVYDAPFYFYGYYGGGRVRRHFGPDFHAWGPGPHYGPHPMWHGETFSGSHAYGGFGGGFHENGGFRGGGGFGGGGFHGGGGGGHR